MSRETDNTKLREAKGYLDLAARLAWRGFGKVEPNPMVGCVLVREGMAGEGVIVGMGHHRVYGGFHAERAALEDCVKRGEPGGASGSTAYVTLEPCNAKGKQPPCVGALIEAGVKRVVYAARDVSEHKGGGAEALRRAGIEAEYLPISAMAARCSMPWAKRMATGLPWVMVKWAQSLDGKLATGTGDSKWISAEASRRWVHVLRGRVDAIVTGSGTVEADDPLLTARGVKIRRRAVRVVVDSGLRTGVARRIVESASNEQPVVIVGADDGAEKRDRRPIEKVQRPGLSVVRKTSRDGRVDLENLLKEMAQERENGGSPLAIGATTILIEAGPGLISAVINQGLADELVCFTAPMLIGGAGMGLMEACRSMKDVETIAAARGLAGYELAMCRRVTSTQDTMAVWRATTRAAGVSPI